MAVSSLLVVAVNRQDVYHHGLSAKLIETGVQPSMAIIWRDVAAAGCSFCCYCPRRRRTNCLRPANKKTQRVTACTTGRKVLSFGLSKAVKRCPPSAGTMHQLQGA